MRTIFSRPNQEAFEQIYRRFVRPDALPWYHPDPPALLQRAVAGLPTRGRALDIGCGDGMCSVFLARAGYRVTSLDFTEGALQLTKGAAEAAGVELETVRANVLEWSTDERFDLIIDSACLHVRGFRESDRPRYKSQILRWLADDGDYLLVHFDRAHRFDWRPLGPRRRSRGEIIALFSPELIEKATDVHTRSVPLPVGPTVLERSYWFRRNPFLRPC